jgi:hypothetical protein
MLYEQLSGRPPFAGDSPEQVADEILRREPKPPRQIRSSIPADLERICLRCLAKRVEDRFSTAGDLANALRAASQRRSLSRRVALGTVCLLLLVGGGVMGAWRLPSIVAQRSAVLDRFRSQVLVWKHGRWENVHVPGVLPLRSGDQLRIHAESSVPRYVYVVWLDTDQQPSAVFPWRQGDWHVRIEEKPLTRLALPQGGPDEVWSMRVARRGCEMVLLLGRDTPLPDDKMLADRLANLPVLAHYPSTGARFSFDELTTLSTTRDFNVAYTERIRDPLVVLQRELKERLEGLFSVMDCLVLPVDDSDPRQ